MKGEDTSTGVIFAELNGQKPDWIRVAANFETDRNQYEWWRMAQLKIRLYVGDYTVKEQKIRLHRFLWQKETKNVFLDIKYENKEVKKVGVIISNMKNPHGITVDNLTIEIFDEK